MGLDPIARNIPRCIVCNEKWQRRRAGERMDPFGAQTIWADTFAKSLIMLFTVFKEPLMIRMVRTGNPSDTSGTRAGI